MTPAEASPTNWDALFTAWLEVFRKPGPRAHERMTLARRRVATNSREDRIWLETALADPERRHFVGWVFQHQPVPRRLLQAFLHAAVLERNPSLNRIFVLPCVRSRGAGEVLRRLHHHLETGTDIERGGAASALYHVAGNPRSETLGPLKAAIQSSLLAEFVRNENVDVRRRILPQLSLADGDHRVEDLPLLHRAVAMARSHADEYLRHRVDVQLSGQGPYEAMPIDSA